MRIENNYQGIMQIFSKVNGGKSTTSNGNYCDNTIDDLRSGHFKNSYGVEGMEITGRTDWNRIVNVSDEMKQHIYNDVKRSFTNMAECPATTPLKQILIMTRFILM